MTRLAASRAREDFSDTLNRVAYGGERIVLRRRGRDLAAIVPMEDLALIEKIEDETDVRDAKGTRSDEAHGEEAGAPREAEARPGPVDGLSRRRRGRRRSCHPQAGP
jgi:prevent-host-death family protein